MNRNRDKKAGPQITRLRLGKCLLYNL